MGIELLKLIRVLFHISLLKKLELGKCNHLYMNTLVKMNRSYLEMLPITWTFPSDCSYFANMSQSWCKWVKVVLTQLSCNEQFLNLGHPRQFFHFRALFEFFGFWWGINKCTFFNFLHCFQETKLTSLGSLAIFKWSVTVLRFS